MPTMIRWWEALRAPQVAKWQYKYRIEWGMPLVGEVEELSGRCGKVCWPWKDTNTRQKRSRSDRFGLGSGESLSSGTVSQLYGHGRRISTFPRMILRVLCGNFEHQRRVQFEGCVAEPLHTITVILPGSKWSCLLLRIVLQDVLSEAIQIHPRLKLRVFANDIPAFFSVRNREKVLEKLKREVEEKGLKLSISEGGKEGGKEGMSKVITSCRYLEEEVSGMQQERRSG